MQTTHHFQRGLNPQTGKPSYRTIVYETLTQLPGITVTPAQMASLLPEHPTQAIRDALMDIVYRPEQYPHIHRSRRGMYRFDPTTPVKVVRQRNSKVMVASVPLNPPASTPTTIAQVPKPESLPVFTMTVPMFDRTVGLVSPDEEVMLVDGTGRYWHAKRIS